ncbi:MAG: ribonuclease Z [Clostridiales bacterium]|nr:ribonuclease Z [Clostridiales bacterium]
MLDIALVGSGGFMPMHNRFLTAMVARLNGKMLLVDCGEGAQINLRRIGWGFKDIDVICFTHFHADHIAGLPGLLLTMGNSDRTEPVTIVGPKGIREVTSHLCVIAPVPFEPRFIELTPRGGQAVSFQAGGFQLSALPLDHHTPCLGYSLTVPRAGRFDADKAKKLGIPLFGWSRLQKGEKVVHEGKSFSPDMVMGPQRKGIKVSYITDTRPVPGIPDFIQGSDLFIAEGLYGDDDMLDQAAQKRHMIFSEAAALAKAGKVDEMWLTHFSPAMPDPGAYLESARRVFPNAVAGRDRMTKTFRFQEEDTNGR